MPDRELLVRIVGDSRDLERALSSTDRKLDSIDKRTQTFGRNVGRAFAAAGIAVGASELFRLTGDAVEAASALNEEISKSRQIFGESSQAIEKWSTTTASSIGISQRAALEATGTFGNLFRVVEIAPQVAADMSQALVQLAGDLASFNNADPTDVLQALRSGLIGEAEPLRRFGVLLSETRVQQQALIETGKRNVQTLTDQEKALARYSIILHDTVQAQGDAARTGDNLAGQSRKLRANVEDLSASIGGILVPSLTALSGAANESFNALERLAGVEITGGFDVGDLAGWVSGWKEINFLIEQARGNVKELSQETQALRPDDRPGLRGPGGIAAEQAARDAVEAQRTLEHSRDAFRALSKGLGLKLDKAGLTADLRDDLDALRELERAILRQIEREGKTFKLVELLTQTRLQINALVEQKAADARQAGQDSLNATMDALDLNLEIARASKTLTDDQTALRVIEQAILNRIEAEGETTDLLRRLFQVRQEQKEIARQLAEQAREDRQRDQFRQLGLTEEGERPTPGSGALLRRAQNLQDQIKGTALDTEKTRNELARIVRFLKSNFKTAGKEVREAILEMLNAISGAFDEGPTGRKGPLTKTSGLNTKKVLEGLGLTAEQINELRSRLSSVNTAGQQLAAIQSSVPGGNFGAGSGASAGAFVVEVHADLHVDGQKMASVVTKQQQKAKRRNPQQKRGPNRNR